jgi:CBS domain-containing protein
MVSLATHDLMRRLPGGTTLSGESLEVLASLSQTADFAGGSLLVKEGEPAPDWYAVLATGAVQVSRLGVGADDILDHLSAGDVLDPGTPGLPAPCSAAATEPTRCLLVPQSAVSRARASGGHPAGPGPAMFVGRIRELINGPPVTCPTGVSAAEAAAVMNRGGAGSVVVIGGDGMPLGIVTDRDLRTRVLAAGRSPNVLVTSIMSAPLVSVAAQATTFDGLLEMTRRNFHHLGVEDEGRLIGVVSSDDLMWLQGRHPVALGREIDGAVSLADLTPLTARIQSLVGWLHRGGAGVFDIGRVAAELNDRLVRRVVHLVEADLAGEDRGRPPVSYSWLAAGSEGRREQTLKTDQDNGLAYEDPPADLIERAAEYFPVLGERVGAALVGLGFPRCEGGFMASNPEWCQSASAWRTDFGGWMASPKPERVLAACIYFDLRPVAGSPEPGETLWQWVCASAPGQTLFLRYLARAAVERHPPLGLFGRFVVERSGAHKDALDLKARGVFPMTQAMRVLALSLGLRETNTVDRLVAVTQRGIFRSAECRELRDAYEVVSRIRLAHQLDCIAEHRDPDNHVDPQRLSKSDRLLLKEAFRTLGWLQRVLEDRFQTAMIP